MDCVPSRCLAFSFFHAGFRQFSGGIVGVDVFFVISGYFMTRDKPDKSYTQTQYSGLWLKNGRLIGDAVEAREAVEAFAKALSVPVTERMFEELSQKVDSSGGDKFLEVNEIMAIRALVEEQAVKFDYHAPSTGKL
jgi:hypothetical protein